ncbi:hypothetical protein [Thomasclavelia spiroformis]|uniref:hypothetical protein n=1 Tax=Thomasclavelia spiroformis TaxID=29348 RepID=UPI003209D40E
MTVLERKTINKLNEFYHLFVEVPVKTWEVEQTEKTHDDMMDNINYFKTKAREIVDTVVDLYSYGIANEKETKAIMDEYTRLNQKAAKIN